MINLATKYSKDILEAYSKGSYIAGHVTDEFDFVGVRSISIYTPKTVELQDYTRSGANRYGDPTELQDDIQELEMKQDKGFAITIDKGNNQDQMMTKNAARMLVLQTKEQVTPYVDKYAFSVFSKGAGTKKGMAAPPEKTDIVGAILDAGTYLDNALVPDDNRVVYLPASSYNKLRQSSEFLNLEGIGTKAVAKGEVGEIASMKVIKVPDSYMPKDVYFLVTHTRSVMQPFKIKDTKLHEDPPGISGALLEGRNYFDAFVLGARANGVYAAVKADKIVAKPTITITSGKATIAGTGTRSFYTLDGSDPRYSKNAQQYAAPVALEPGQVIRAYSDSDDMFCSEVVEAKR